MSLDRTFTIGLLRCCLALPLLAAASAPALAQDDRPLFDPQQLPAFSGQVQLFTLTPVGDIDGFVLTDGTEVKTPPHLSRRIAATIRPGDEVTIHGLKAAALPLIQAMSVTNDATERTVVDAGPEAGAPRPPPPPPPREDDSRGQTVSVQGQIRMLLHGPRGDVNGVLLQNGAILRLPPPEALRLANLLVPGHPLAAKGLVRAATGQVVDLTALGPSAERLTPVMRGSGPRPPA